MDRTYLHAKHTHTHTKDKSWTNNSNEGFKKKMNKGQKLIIIHAGGENSFLTGVRVPDLEIKYIDWRLSP